MSLLTRQGREDSAGNLHSSFCSNAMTVVIFHGVERAGVYLMIDSIIAFELLERAIRLNPVVPWWFYSGYGLALHLVGHKVEAAQWLEKSDAERQRADTYARLAAVYVDLNRMEDAKAAAGQALLRNPKLTVTKYRKANPLKHPRRFAWNGDLLVRSGIPE